MYSWLVVVVVVVTFFQTLHLVRQVSAADSATEAHRDINLRERQSIWFLSAGAHDRMCCAVRTAGLQGHQRERAISKNEVPKAAQWSEAHQGRGVRYRLQGTGARFFEESSDSLLESSLLHHTLVCQQALRYVNEQPNRELHRRCDDQVLLLLLLLVNISTNQDIKVKNLPLRVWSGSQCSEVAENCGWSTNRFYTHTRGSGEKSLSKKKSMTTRTYPNTEQRLRLQQHVHLIHRPVITHQLNCLANGLIRLSYRAKWIVIPVQFVKCWSRFTTNPARFVKAIEVCRTNTCNRQQFHQITSQQSKNRIEQLSSIRCFQQNSACNTVISNNT
jgi:hypothetical protein